MSAIFAIARRELLTLFYSPLAWSILGVIQFILAYFFLIQLEAFALVQPRLAAIEGAPGVTDIVVAPVLSNAAIVLLLVVPMLTMRLLSEERRQRTLSLLFSAPVSMTEIALGKYLGIMVFFSVMLVLTAMMPLSLLNGGTLDFGKVASGFLGLFLVLAAFSSAGLYMSSLTSQPTIAAVSTFGLLLLLWIIDWAGNAQGANVSGLFAYLSLLRHYESLLKGVFNSTDVGYYLLFTMTFLIMTIRKLDMDRLQG